MAGTGSRSPATSSSSSGAGWASLPLDVGKGDPARTEGKKNKSQGHVFFKRLPRDASRGPRGAPRGTWAPQCGSRGAKSCLGRAGHAASRHAHIGRLGLYTLGFSSRSPSLGTPCPQNMFSVYILWHFEPVMRSSPFADIHTFFRLLCFEAQVRRISPSHCHTTGPLATK